MAKEINLGILTDCKAGISLAQKFADKQTEVSICSFNGKDYEESKSFLRTFSEMNKSGNLELLLDYDALIMSLSKPRIIVIVCRNFTREDIRLLSEKLEAGDIIIDCCDVNYKDSISIAKQLARTNINYLGTGYVFTTEKLINAPAFMFSGNKEIYDVVSSAFSEISTYTDGVSCASYIGPDGSGQFVKMVCTSLYNTFLELIAETIFLLRYMLNISPEEIKDILIDYSSGEVSSFLLDTAADLIGKRDSETGEFIIDITLDRIIQAKRDIWIAKYAYDLGCPVPTITAASNIRLISGFISERVAASNLTDQPVADRIKTSEVKDFIEACRKTLYTGMICCVSQLFSLLKKASDQYGWDLDLYTVACTLQGGTFANSEIMYRVIDAYRNYKCPENIIVNDYFSKIIKDYSVEVRKIVCKIIEHGLPLHAFISSIEYIDSYRSRRLQTPVIQLIKDCIAENGFEKINSSGVFYGEWDSPDDVVKTVKSNE